MEECDFGDSHNDFYKKQWNSGKFSCELAGLNITIIATHSEVCMNLNKRNIEFFFFFLKFVFSSCFNFYLKT